jgi:predicted phosphodiesterase
MKKILKWIFERPIAWLAEKISSAPQKKEVFKSLNRLVRKIKKRKNNNGLIIPFDHQQEKLIIFSDQHKGLRDDADDFKNSEQNYIAALSYYEKENFQFVNLGDCEELWKNTPEKVVKKNGPCLESEKKFLAKNHYFRVFGNHDIEWKYRLQQVIFLMPIFGTKLKVYEGLIFKTNYNAQDYFLFMAHGHQGDLRSDGNPFSAWVVANIWTPIQRYLQISINTPATSFELTDKHNIIMHEWSATQKNLLFISGHTHKPVFASMDHIDKLNQQLHHATHQNDTHAINSINQELDARKQEYAGKQEGITKSKPSYFNTGCCCFEDGDITGIEISDGYIRLIKWHQINNIPQRIVLEEAELEYVFDQLS